MELDSSKPNIRDEIDTPRGAIFNLSSVAQSLDGGNIRLSMLANYARSSSQARTHPVARMEATRLIIPSFLDELLRAQQRGRGEKNLLLSRRTRGRMYTEDGLEEGEGRRGSSVPFAGQTHRNSYRNYVLRPRSRGSWLIPWMRQPNRDRTTPAVQPGRHNGRIAHRDKDLGRQLMSNDDCVLSTAVSDLVVKCGCNSLVGASARGVN